jgi:hypothetical protein
MRGRTCNSHFPISRSQQCHDHDVCHTTDAASNCSRAPSAGAVIYRTEAELNRLQRGMMHGEERNARLEVVCTNYSLSSHGEKVHVTYMCVCYHETQCILADDVFSIGACISVVRVEDQEECQLVPNGAAS